LLRTELFTQVTFDSGALSPLTQVVHQLKGPGRYAGSVLHGDQVIAAFTIAVEREAAAQQVSLDLSSLHRADCDLNAYSLREGGYVLLHASRGSGYAATLAAGEELAFDSRSLGDGDLFAATILRPGAYEATNELGRTKARLRVPYPEARKERYVPPDPVRVASHGDGFDPSEFELSAAQGLVFEARDLARVTIRLLKPDDGPGPGRPENPPSLS
jgi:hypothetical protein